MALLGEIRVPPCLLFYLFLWTQREMVKKNKTKRACTTLLHEYYSPSNSVQLGLFSELDVVSVYLLNISEFSLHLLVQSYLDPTEHLGSTASFGDRFHWLVMQCVKNYLMHFCSETGS